MEQDKSKSKDNVKGKIILFVIGVLVGAIVATSVFFVCTKMIGTGSSTGSSSSQQMPGGGTPPEMPSGQNGQNGAPDMQNSSDSEESDS